MGSLGELLAYTARIRGKRDPLRSAILIGCGSLQRNRDYTTALGAPSMAFLTAPRADPKFFRDNRSLVRGVEPVIIDCPSCGTAYRHAIAPAQRGVSARCSRCESVFPVRAGRRRYRVVHRTSLDTHCGGPVPTFPGAASAVGTGTRMHIGMDDPSLAPHLENTALDGRGGSAMTYLVDVESAPQTPAIVADEGTEASREGAGVRPFFKVLVGLTAGAATGWALVFQYPVMEFTRSVLVAAGVAVVVTWVGLRWKRTSH